MSDIEKFYFAVWIVKHLMFNEKKILAISAIRELYNCGIADAKKVVELIDSDMASHFIKNLKDIDESL